MELDEAPAPTSRLDHLAELATSPSHAVVHPPSSSSSTASSSSNQTPRQPYPEDSRHHLSSQPPHRPASPPHMRDTRASSPAAHHSRSQIVQQQLEAESAPTWGRSPITPTTTRNFNRMAIHEVLEGSSRSHRHEEGHGSPPYKRKGSPEEASFSDPPTSSRARSARSLPSTSADHPPQYSHRYRQESPMPQSNSDDDEESDIRNYKKRRMLTSASSSQRLQPPSSSSSSSTTASTGPPEVMDQVRTTLMLKQQQKAIIEARQSGVSSTGPPTSAAVSSTSTSPQNSKPKEALPSTTSASGSTSSSNNNNNNNNNSSSSNSNSNNGQAVTEKTSSGISVFHGSASFAAHNRRPLTSPMKAKNAKSLTIFAPSYSDSSLSIHSAPLQPSQAHQAMMNPRTSQPIRNHTPHQPHPFSQHQHQAPPTGTIPQPLRSPKTAGHVKKSSRVTLRAVPHTAGLDASSGTLPAPILSSHTGPLPSPMFPHPTTPFHPTHSGLGGPSGHISKPAFMETISNLFDSVDSTRSLKHTLEEQIRKSAQLLQTLQSSGTMIESLVRGQFKELEKGVIDKFESEIDYLSQRVRILEEHQGLSPPPKKARISSTPSSSKNAMTGVTSTSGSLPSPPSGSNGSKADGSHGTSELKDGTLPTPPLNKNQDSAMEIEDEEATTGSSSSTPTSSSPREQASEYQNSVKKLQERVASLEKRQTETTAQA